MPPPRTPVGRWGGGGGIGGALSSSSLGGVGMTWRDVREEGIGGDGGIPPGYLFGVVRVGFV